MTNKGIVTTLMLALVVWGILLAIGSTGYFIESSLLDLRKSLIVATCMAAFLGLWMYVLRAEDMKHVAAAPVVSGWSKPGLFSLVMGLLAVLVWVGAVVSYGDVSKSATTVLGWSVAALVMAAATSGIIALANPGRLRGKWLGFCGLLESIVALIVFVVRMSS